MTDQSPVAAPTRTEQVRTPRSAIVASYRARAWATLRDYARRVWDSSGEDDIFFLASGIAFNILLAAVPFVLLVISGLVYALRLTPDASLAEVRTLIDHFLPPHSESIDLSAPGLLEDVIGARDVLGAYGAVTFVWFSTRLFGSLRTVLGEIFDVQTGRGIIAGKWFDIRITIYSSLLLVAYLVLSTYLALASSRGIGFLAQVGLREDVMGRVEYVIGRLIAFALMVAIFWALYKYLPHRKIRWQQALVGAIASSLLLELARNLWTAFTESFDPGSIYSGTLYAIVSLVFWVYYAALIFIIGGEVSQAHELRRVRRMQRETMEE